MIPACPSRCRSHASSPPTGARFCGARGSDGRPAYRGSSADTRPATSTASASSKPAGTSHRTTPAWSCHGARHGTSRVYHA